MTIVIDSAQRIITYDSLNAIEHIVKITSKFKDMHWWIIKQTTADSLDNLKDLQAPLKL